VPGGGITKSGRWKTTKSKGKFLFPVKAMSKVYRARYLEQLRKRCTPGQPLLNELFKKNWVVYAKRPFGHPMAVVEYLGRYTHKVAISNHRITAIDSQTVSFGYKDYRQGGKKLEATLSHGEFIRRFMMHILPCGFMRIRHYGILSSSGKGKYLPIIREQLPPEILPWKEPRVVADSFTPGLCPHCKTATMITLEIIPSRGPPALPQSTQAFDNESKK
jgi:hypothetical protein